MDTAVYLQIALLAYFCLIICHMARYDKTFQFVHIDETQKLKHKQKEKKNNNNNIPYPNALLTFRHF